jgi:Na+-driven multidrug efflux pump
MIPLAFGVGSALTALVGRAAGAGDWPTARRTAWTGGTGALLLAGTVGIATSLLPNHFARTFSSDPDVITIATQALQIIGPAYGAFGLGMALYFASMGANRMQWPATAALARITIAVGSGYLLNNTHGLQGQFIAVAAGLTTYGTLIATSVRPGVWSAHPTSR